MKARTGKLRYTLRSLMGAVTLLTIIVGFVAWQIRAAEAAKAARAYYGQLGRYEEAKSGEWLVLQGKAISDDTLRSLSCVRGLYGLNLRDTSVTDEGLGHLVECTELRALNVSNASVSDDSLHHLAKCPDLAFVNFEHTDVSLEGVYWLRNRLPQSQVTWYPRHQGD